MITNFILTIKNKAPWKTLGKLVLFFLIIICLFIFYLFVPSPSLHYLNLPPISDYQTSLEKIAQDSKTDSDLVGENCKSILLTHGTKTEKVIVFFHGYTSCPGQFKALGERLFNEGYNVYIPRAPYHGYKDKATTAINKLTSQQYTEYAEKAVQMAHGLGNQITVSGLSGGGNLATWIAINDNSIEKAVIISPGYGFLAIPKNLTTPAAKLFMLLPSTYVLYDSNSKQGDPNGDVYAGYTTTSLANVLNVGRQTYEKMLKLQISTKKIAFVINDNDNQISLEAFNDVKNTLEENSGKNGFTFESYVFPKSMNLQHDYIDANFNQATIETTYKEIVRLIMD